MGEMIIYVKPEDGKWGVNLKDANGSNTGVVKMQTKEDAVRYARTCEQRTGNKVLLPK